MKEYQSHKKEEKLSFNEPNPGYSISYGDQEEARLRKAIYMSDVEKFKSFTRMLRRNAMLKKAVFSHKKI